MIDVDGITSYRTVVSPRELLLKHRAVLPSMANISCIAMKINLTIIKYLRCLHRNIGLALRLLIARGYDPGCGFQKPGFLGGALFLFAVLVSYR